MTKENNQLSEEMVEAINDACEKAVLKVYNNLARTLENMIDARMEKLKLEHTESILKLKIIKDLVNETDK